MPKSLQDLIQQPSDAISTIQLAIKTKEGSRIVWCVVEGEDDKDFYERFFSTCTTKVLPSRGKDGKMGCANVEAIVTHILTKVKHHLIIGIRDRDYTGYNHGYKYPKNVFCTDCRDLEMMMLSAASVNAGLTKMNPSYSQVIKKCYEVCLYLGYLRIYNYIYDLNFSFRDHCKITSVWNNGTHSLEIDWKKKLFSEFTNNLHVSSKQIKAFLKKKRMSKELPCNVCRGHDVVKLLSYMMVKNNYSQEQIINCMTGSYTVCDFINTKLYKTIKKWGKSNCVKVFNN